MCKDSDGIQNNVNNDKMIKELIALNKKLESFAYRVSHDLQSPLNSIKALVNFIEEESKEDNTLEYIAMIKKSIFYLDNSIQNNLKYSRITSKDLIISNVFLRETFQDVVDLLYNDKCITGVNFQIEIEENEPFFTDKFRFNMILENLIGNAIKYQQKNKSDKYVFINGSSGGGKFRFVVSDNGIGIAALDQDKIFNKFFRESNNENGFGLGLYMVKQAVEMLKGTIRVESYQGIGTSFIVELENFTAVN